ncbi:hypothetical protein D3C87_1954880 [compost metagenome]
MVVRIAGKKKPAPAARPIAATTHREAAVVKPVMERPLRRMVPAPKKPIPLMTCAASLAGSILTPGCLANSGKPWADRSMINADPRHTRI